MTTHGEARLGWIGAGRMGSVLAQRLLEAGLDVAVHNRTRAKAEPLAELGATVVDSPADLADRDIVFTMVAGSQDFEDVTLGEGGVLTRPDVAPAMLIDSSTISVAASERVRIAAEARGTDVLAAPVSGNPKVAAAGRLTSRPPARPTPSSARARTSRCSAPASPTSGTAIAPAWSRSATT